MAAPPDPYNTPGWTSQYLITTLGEISMARAPTVNESGPHLGVAEEPSKAIPERAGDFGGGDVTKPEVSPRKAKAQPAEKKADVLGRSDPVKTEKPADPEQDLAVARSKAPVQGEQHGPKDDEKPKKPKAKAEVKSAKPKGESTLSATGMATAPKADK